MHTTIKFRLQQKRELAIEMRERVNAYFKENKISKYGDFRMYIKTLIMLTIYWTPFVLILTVPMPTWAMLLLYGVIGVGLAGIGMGIMHDAVHGSYSSSPSLNRVIGYTMNMLGGSSLNWRVQHNVLHHTYTNIEGVDEDIRGRGLLRLSPNAPWSKAHRYQHIYGFFLYTLLTLNWIFNSDFAQLKRYSKWGLIEQVSKRPKLEVAIFFVIKAVYLAVMIALPIILGIPWGIALLGFVILHMVGGFILTIVFQLAHVIEGTEYPMPANEGQVEHSWIEHQLRTTANFAPKNTLLSWYVGGLNYQIEHHLFPNISHLHYPAISKIVKETALEYDMPYHTFPTFFSAVGAHVGRLRDFGKGPVVEVR